MTTLSDDDLTLHGEEVAGAVRFAAQHGGTPIGRVDLAVADGVGRLSWDVDSDAALISRLLRLVVDHAFSSLQVERVETYAAAADRVGQSAAARAGLRREGIVRGGLNGHDGVEGRRDAVLLGRLVTDPAPSTREAFTAALNAGLPTKRAIAQALIRDDAGRVLVCELVYKTFWDLPGGVVDPHESPAAAVLRELREELGVDATVRDLAVVSWLPPWRGWDDATLFLFDVTLPQGALDRVTLEMREIRAIHWVDDATLRSRAADYTVRLVERAVQQLDEGAGTAYLEDGRDPVW